MPVLQSALRDRRLAQQHAAYQELAVGISESSGYAIPKAVGGEVERYAQPPGASTRAGEQADPHGALAWFSCSQAG